MGRIVDIEQQTDAWHDWRSRGIGASEAPTILGENPHQTDLALFQLKTGRRQPDKEFAQSDGRPDPRAHGRAHEDLAREKLCEKLGTILYPVCMEHESIPFMFSSPDFFNEDDFIGGDIKCPDDIRNHLLAREGRIPPEYRAQLQHQIEVARKFQTPPVGEIWNPETAGVVSDSQLRHREGGYPAWYYASYWAETEELIVIPVEPDIDYIEKRLIPAEERFWFWIQEDKYPMPQGEGLLTSDDPLVYASAAELVRRYGDHQAMLEEAKRLVDADRMELQRLMNGKAKLRIGDLAVLSRNYRRGNIDWWNVPGIKNLIAGKTDDEIRYPGNLDFRVRRLK